jgi:hypothetical protein
VYKFKLGASVVGNNAAEQSAPSARTGGELGASAVDGGVAKNSAPSVQEDLVVATSAVAGKPGASVVDDRAAEHGAASVEEDLGIAPPPSLVEPFVDCPQGPMPGPSHGAGQNMVDPRIASQPVLAMEEEVERPLAETSRKRKFPQVIDVLDDDDEEIADTMPIDNANSFAETFADTVLE